MRKTELEWFKFRKWVDGQWADIDVGPVPGEALAVRKLADYRAQHPGERVELERANPPPGMIRPRHGKPGPRKGKGRWRS